MLAKSFTLYFGFSLFCLWSATCEQQPSSEHLTAVHPVLFVTNKLMKALIKNFPSYFCNHGSCLQHDKFLCLENVLKLSSVSCNLFPFHHLPISCLGKHHPSSFPQSPPALSSHPHQHGRLLWHPTGETTVSTFYYLTLIELEVNTDHKWEMKDITSQQWIFFRCCFSRASAAVNNLKRFHEKKKKGLKPHSLYLDHIIRKSVSSHNRRESHSRSHRDIYVIKVSVLSPVFPCYSLTK